MLFKEKTVWIALIVMTAIALHACGGGNGTDANKDRKVDIRHGVFTNSAVEGVRFETATLDGLTTSEGLFSYRPNETVHFSIGSVALGSAPGASVLTPIDLVPGASGVDESSVINRVRFLHSLDEDYFPDNGIRILPSVHEALQYAVVDFGVPIEEFETVVTPVISLIAQTHMNGPRAMVPVEQARASMTDTLAAIDGTIGGHRISHQFVFEPALTHALFRAADDTPILSRETMEVRSWVYSYNGGVDQGRHLLHPPPDALVTPPLNVPLVAILSYHLSMHGDIIERARGLEYLDRAKTIAYSWQNLNQRVSEMSYMREAHPGSEDSATVDEDPYITWKYSIVSPLLDLRELALIEGTYLIVSRIRIRYPESLEP